MECELKGVFMHFNIHTHTFRCNHALGSEREYIENAISNNIKTLGFSDHAPYIFKNGHHSGFRMTPDQINDYFVTLMTLKEEYKDDIQIYIGFEAEYYPAIFDLFLKFIQPYHPDFLILGQHFLNNEYDGVYSGQATDNCDTLKLYVSQTINALKTGCFTYFAHPDLINFQGDRNLYLKEMEKVCVVAKELDIPLEINLLGVLENRAYPREDFFKLAADIGNVAILGSDAHQPQNVYNLPVIEKALKFADKVGIKVVDSLALKPIFKEDI